MEDLDYLYLSLAEKYGDAESSEDEECQHTTKIVEDGIRICQSCGMTEDTFDFEPEWRNYGEGNTSRCCSIQQPQWSLEKDFINWGIDIPSSIRIATENKYRKIVDMLKDGRMKKSGRGKGRKSIIASCLLHVYREKGDCRTFDDLINMFDLSKKSMFNGLTLYYECFQNDRIKYVTPEDLIPGILDKFNFEKERYPIVLKLARSLKNTSRNLKTSKPKSVASSIVYFYLCMNPSYKKSLGITKASFASTVDLSDITITKYVKDIGETCGVSPTILAMR